MLSISGDFLQPLNDSVSSLFNMVDDHFGDRFTYGLPESQELVERALGDELVASHPLSVQVIRSFYCSSDILIIGRNFVIFSLLHFQCPYLFFVWVWLWLLGVVF